MNSFNKIEFKKEYNYKRLSPEKEDFRSAFQRDRDRVLHSNAFRRLAHKTQVFFLSNNQDHFRNRLTHSLEVSQIARSISAMMRLDEALTEAISLAHDLGHPPFGHIGEGILNDIMLKNGNNGFNHNIQTLRIITKLEQKYGAFDGLNLTYETLEGILKHSGPVLKSNYIYYQKFQSNYNINLATQSSLEAQIAAISDDIAYNCHDIDDGIRANLFTLDDLCEIDLIKKHLDNIRISYPNIDAPRITHELKRNLINSFIVDIVDESSKNLLANKIKTHHDVMSYKDTIITLSDYMREQLSNIRIFLSSNMYQSNLILDHANYTEEVIMGLFFFYKENLNKLPLNLNTTKEYPRDINRIICDFISGMTDNYADEQYRKLKKK
ncbi:MAG: deoxyguanosinetriphosphate triphosphohydrolase [Rhodobiaceae bacterium]|nr:deoxyguanosinetriphosphate triphosphohydrolase [Rhodobiaceae bacterium]